MRAFDIGQVIFRLLHETGKAEPVQLIPGQVISVTVKEVRGDTALLSYQGKEIIARLESEVPPGGNIRCLVEGEKNGRVVLKMLDNSRGNTGFLNKVLRDLGLKINEANIRLVSEMIRQEMPLTPDTVRKLAAFAGSQDIPGADMRVPVFMHKHGIPLTGEMYRYTRELLTDMRFLQDELLQMSLFNQRLAAGDGPGTQPARLAEALHRVLSGLRLNVADPPEIIAAKLADMFAFQAGRPANTAAGEPGLPQQGVSQQGLPQQGLPQQGVSQQGLPQQGLPQRGLSQLQNQAPQSQTHAAMPGSGRHTGLPQPGTGPNGMPQPGTGPNSLWSGTGPSGLPQPGAAQTRAPQPGAVANGGQQSGAAQGQGQQSGVVQTGTAPGGTLQGGQVPGGTLPGEMAQSGARLPGMQQNGAGQPGTVQSGTAQPGNERVYSQVLTVLREAGDQGQKALITLLAEKLTELLADKGSREHSELLQLTKSVTERLEFLRDFNNRVEVNRDNTLVMYSTINFEDRQEPLRLLINYRYDSKKQKRDFSSCRVEVKLNTVNMGLVRCEIQVAERNLTLQFVARDEQTCNTIDKLKGILARRLEDMSYDVRMLESRVEMQDPDLLMQDDNDMSGMFQLNLRV